MLYRATGQLVYYDRYVVLYVARQLSDFYRSLIPKYKYVQPQKYPPHITVVRSFETPSKINWGFRNKDTLTIFYSNQIHYDNPYYYLNVYSTDVELVRRKLGLKRYRQSYGCYHLTLGNDKKEN